MPKMKPSLRDPGVYGALYVTSMSIRRDQQDWTYEIGTKYGVSRSHVIRRALDLLRQHIEAGGNYHEEG